MNTSINECEPIVLTEDAVADFLDFLETREQYLDTGLGAFHTDDHSNW